MKPKQSRNSVSPTIKQFIDWFFRGLIFISGFLLCVVAVHEKQWMQAILAAALAGWAVAPRKIISGLNVTFWYLISFAALFYLAAAR